MTDRNCSNCKWLSCKFTSVCVNADSPNVADFVSEYDTCKEWEQKKEATINDLDD